MTDTLKAVEIGTQVLAKELVGKSGFNIAHDTTYIDNVNSVKWFSATKTAVVITYDGYQTVTVPANEVYVWIKDNAISYEDNVYNFLGVNWREKYNYKEDNSTHAIYDKKIKALIKDNASKILFHECNLSVWGHISYEVRKALGIYRGVKTVKDYSVSELAKMYVTSKRELFRLVEPE
ncbi:hypothetical protein LD11_gp276 [Bacillus phage Riley]|uniref:Uncharacterized protein n=1 Tax=Bacillus phage Riley TaxID=1486662 RepID=A0A075M037_9CAUD|nr:hypothetical protein LD11_gp276 [Bacillus phage Riley]AIF72152.1 hypothetical protein [Bacillus phage Riley]